MKTLGIITISILIITACFVQQCLAGDDAQELYETAIKFYNSNDYVEALKWWRKAADQGHVKSQLNMGLMHLHGRGVTQDFTEAMKWYRKVADQGNADAQFGIAGMYAGGKGVAQNHDEALKWCRKAADQGHAKAQLNVGIMYLRGKGVTHDFTESVKWLQKAADQGNADAQNELGLSYYNGNGVAKDFTEAAKLFRKAADQGNADAQFYLGVALEKGEGVTHDFTESVKWLQKAADQGKADAQLNIGLKYSKGQGVPQNYTEAEKWFRKAADQGNSMAQRNLGVVYAIGEGVPQNYEEAMKWFRKAADQGNEVTQFYIGSMYSKGQGVPQNYEEAMKWFRKAADQGYADAKDQLVAMELKTGSKRIESLSEAILCYDAIDGMPYMENSFLKLPNEKRYIKIMGIVETIIGDTVVMRPPLRIGFRISKIKSYVPRKGEWVEAVGKIVALEKALTLVGESVFFIVVDPVVVVVGAEVVYSEGITMSTLTASEQAEQTEKSTRQPDNKIITKAEEPTRQPGMTSLQFQIQRFRTGASQIEYWHDAKLCYDPIDGISYAQNPPLRFPDEKRYITMVGFVKTIIDDTVICEGEGTWGFQTSKVDSYTPIQGQLVRAIGKIVSLNKAQRVSGKMAFFVVIDPVAILVDGSSGGKLVYSRSPATGGD